MKKVAFIVSLCFLSLVSRAQSVKVTSFSEIEKRIAQSEDSVYVINFWATWCAPCIKELPYFDQLQKEFSADKMKVILLSLDFRSKLESTVIPFAEKRKIQSEIFLLQEKDMNGFINRVDEKWSGAIPATIIVNKRSGKSAFYEQEFTYEELKANYLEVRSRNSNQ